MSEQENMMPTRGIPLELGGKTLRLRYSLKARRQLMELLGEDVATNFKKLAGENLASILVIGLSKSAPDITADWLEDEIDMENLPMVVEALGRAFGVKSVPVITMETDTPGEALPAPSASGTTPE